MQTLNSFTLWIQVCTGIRPQTHFWCI